MVRTNSGEAAPRVPAVCFARSASNCWAAMSGLTKTLSESISTRTVWEARSPLGLRKNNFYNLVRRGERV